MPKENTAYLVEQLPEEVQKGGRLPVVYYKMRPETSTAPSYRFARSDTLRASAFHCQPFDKPISRCIDLGAL